MRIESKAASIVWKLVLVSCAVHGLLDGSGILANSCVPIFPHLFMNASAIVFWSHSLDAGMIVAISALSFDLMGCMVHSHSGFAQRGVEKCKYESLWVATSMLPRAF